MSLILVSKNDIAVGKPSPCPLYDQERNVLLDQGATVRDDMHLDSLLSRGAFRELSWETSSNNDENSAVAHETKPEPDKSGKSDNCFTFDDMKLNVESRLQLEPPAKLSRERILVKVIGYLKGASLLVTAPATSNGIRLQFIEGEEVVMRSFSGQNAFAFACTVERACKLPYEYLHLSFPDVIQGVMIRKAPRVKTSIIAAAQNANQCSNGDQVSALISNISANGAALDAKTPLGSKGDILDLTFRVKLHKIDAFLSVKGIIRAVFSNEASDPSNPFRHGIEFHDLQPNDMIILQSMIYQQIVENPHHII